MKVFKWSKEDSSPYMNQEKCSICSQIILIVKSLCKVEWNLKRVSNLILGSMTIICEQIWFDMTDTLHVKISKSKHYWWKNNNYTEKQVTERLS
jgi:hypothetical protein